VSTGSAQPPAGPPGPRQAEVLVEATGGVATVTLNRPGSRNALSSSMLAALRDRLAWLDSRPGVGAIVLTGADPAFCAGLDLNELARGDGRLAELAGVGSPLPELGTPLIGAVNGAAITGGLEIALACDFLVASERAVFADSHARAGIFPGWGLTVRLPEAVGLRRARQMSATGNFIDAATALAWGLVNHVVPHERLLEFARGLAADIAASDRESVHAILSAYRQGSLVTCGEAWALEARAHAGWRGGGFDPGEVARRRQAVISRGRAQAAPR
jgi:enoyl-CoA hydratase